MLTVKHQSIYFCYFKSKIQINANDIVLLTLILTISSPQLLRTTTRASFARNYCVL